MPVGTTIRLRRGTAASWTSANPVLAGGEPGFETDTGLLKIGDGSTAWNSLAYFNRRPWSVTAIKTGTYTAALEEVVRCDPSGGGFTVNLVSAAGVAGREVIIKNVTTSTNTITIDPDGSETADGSSTVTITSSRGCVRLQSDGTNWMVV